MTTDERQKKARKKYRDKKEVKTNYAKYQKENYKNIAATYKRSEAEYISGIFTAYGVTPAQVMRGAAAALLNGEQIRTESGPLPIPPE